MSFCNEKLFNVMWIVQSFTRWWQLIFYFHPYLGKLPVWTHIFRMGWFNHQPEKLLNIMWIVQSFFYVPHWCFVTFSDFLRAIFISSHFTGPEKSEPPGFSRPPKLTKACSGFLLQRRDRCTRTYQAQ